MNIINKNPYEKRILNLKIANLQAFVAAADRGSFSQAAAQLHLTQPSISRRIADLENLLACRLFDRLGSSILLTEAGQRLLPKAKTILAQARDIQCLMLNLGNKVSGQLNLGVSGYIAESYLRPIMQIFTSQYPEVELDIRLFGSSKEAYHLLESGELDLVLATLPLSPLDELLMLELWQDELVFVVSQQHPLANRAKITRQQLVRYPAIVPERGTFTRDIIDTCFAEQNLTIQLAPQISKPINFSVIKMMVSLGLGWSILPKFILDETFSPLNVSDITLTRRLGIVRHASRTPSNATLEFIRICEATVQQPA